MDSSVLLSRETLTPTETDTHNLTLMMIPLGKESNALPQRRYEHGFQSPYAPDGRPRTESPTARACPCAHHEPLAPRKGQQRAIGIRLGGF